MILKKVLLLFIIPFFLIGCQNTKESNEIDNTPEVNGDKINEQFFRAAEHGNISKIKSLLESGIDINIIDNKGRTAVMIATYANDPETVKVLIDYGADIDIQDDMKNNPFLYAGAEGFLEILRMTIDAGANPNLLNRYGGTALIPASEHGYVGVVRELLENTDIDVNLVNNLGWTAMMEAIVLSEGGKIHQETIKLLIEHGADVNIADSKGVTPLQHSKDRGFEEIEEILLHAGAE